MPNSLPCRTATGLHGEERNQKPQDLKSVQSPALSTQTGSLSRVVGAVPSVTANHLRRLHLGGILGTLPAAQDAPCCGDVGIWGHTPHNTQVELQCRESETSSLDAHDCTRQADTSPMADGHRCSWRESVLRYPRRGACQHVCNRHRHQCWGTTPYWATLVSGSSHVRYVRKQQTLCFAWEVVLGGGGGGGGGGTTSILHTRASFGHPGRHRRTTEVSRRTGSPRPHGGR